MKIIITENKLRELQLQYLNGFLGNISNFDNFIIIYYPNYGDEDDFESDVLMEYDYDDGRLYIDKTFLTNFSKIYFPNDDDAGPFIKDWFENEFGVDIDFMDS
jgi:hypothetical protein